MISKGKAIEKVKDLKSNFRRALNPVEVANLICNHKEFRNWTDDEFELVMNRLMKYDNYPENLLNTMEDIHNHKHPKVNFLRDCWRCNNTGYRYYKTTVLGIERTCIAACGCDHGRLKHEKEGTPWYNEVIKRSDVKPVEDDEPKRQEEILEPLEDSHEEHEELPFII